MYWYSSQFFGMHLFWWIFWVAIIIALISWAPPVPRRTVRLYREDPLGILQRRYAAGEITTEEYELRKSNLERDRRDPRVRPVAKTRSDRDAHA
jgi:putative membrane protein